MDTRDPRASALANTVSLSHVGQRVRFSEDHAFVSEWDNGLEILELSEGGVARHAGIYTDPGFFFRGPLAVSNNFVFLLSERVSQGGAYSAFLDVLDIAKAGSPRLAARLELEGFGLTRDLQIDGDFLKERLSKNEL